MTTAEQKEEIELLLATYMTALGAVASGQSYSIGDMTLERADSANIQTTIDKLRRQLIDIDVDIAGGQQGVRTPRWS